MAKKKAAPAKRKLPPKKTPSLPGVKVARKAPPKKDISPPGKVPKKFDSKVHCIACSGSGISSVKNPCTPCKGTGFKQCRS